jgi:hypothetical protein
VQLGCGCILRLGSMVRNLWHVESYLSVQILQCAAQHLWCVCLVCKAGVSGSTEYEAAVYCAYFGFAPFVGDQDARVEPRVSKCFGSCYICLTFGWNETYWHVWPGCTSATGYVKGVLAVLFSGPVDSPFHGANGCLSLTILAQAAHAAIWCCSA